MFIPIGDDNSRITITPVVVWLIVAVNAVVWLLQLQFGETFTFAYATIPYEITQGIDLTKTETLVIEGQRLPLPHTAGPSPIYLTLITAMFMHGSWMHIIGNMVYLIIFGDQIEDRLGHKRFLLFYLLCGLVASLAHIAASPQSVIPTVGASGAIAGVLGAYVCKHPRNRVKVLVFRSVVFLPAIVVLGGWFALQFLGHVNTAAAEAGGIAYMAHIGGFVAGCIGIYLLPPRRR